jgi:hypothetical protein
VQLLLLIEITCERVELVVPEFLVVRDPGVRFLHRLGLQGAAHHAAFLAALDEAGPLEHRKVLHEAWQRHLVLVRKLGYGAAALLERSKDMAPRTIG